MRTFVGILFGLGFLMTSVANPLGFAEYEQEVSAQFATAEAARAATLRATDLPEGCPRIFTTRWDDSNPAHVAKAEMLTANGFRANFYLNGGKDYLRDCGARLLSLGHALGNHTSSHPHLMALSSSAAWREILGMKIQIETELSTPCVAYAAPYGWEKTESAERPALTVRMLQASGHYICDDWPVVKPDWDCARDAWFETGLFWADDIKPSRTLYAQRLEAAEALLARRPEIGRLTFGIHSWCDAEGTKRQGEMLSDTRRTHPDWFYCHANAAGAYRYSARFGRIRKTGVTGCRATWRVTRFDPVELGDGIPLSLAFSEKPSQCALSEGRNGTYALPHAVPTTFRIAKPDEVMVELSVDASKGLLRVRVANKTKKPLERVHLVAYVPPVWRDMRQTVSLKRIAALQTVENAFKLGLRGCEGVADEDLLYAVSVDFMSAGQRHRAWGTRSEKPCRLKK